MASNPGISPNNAVKNPRVSLMLDERRGGDPLQGPG
jgi:hypothetical protein